MPGRGVRKEKEEEEEEEEKRAELEVEDIDEEEYELEDVRERITSSRASRFNLLANELRLPSTLRKFSRETLLLGIKDLSRGLVIHPDNWYVPYHLSLLIEHDLVI
jgi:hypothetical protein